MALKIVMEKNLVYGKTERELLTADIFRPSEGKDIPIVILIHGGWFQSGSKEMYREWGQYLAESGVAAMAINYRLMTPSYSIYPSVLDDIQAAINFIIRHANEWGVEPQRLGLIGDSAGGHLASQFSLLYATNASFKIRAVVGAYGVYHLKELWKTSTDNQVRLKRLLGASYEDNRSIYIEASPIHSIEKALTHPIFDTRYFLTWGKTDKVIPPTQSVNFSKKLRNAGIQTETFEISDKGHFWFNLLPKVEGGRMKDYPNTIVATEVLKFLKKVLCQEEIGNFSISRIEQLKSLM
ncbi:alpha/beta hydrolase [Alteribacillus iranensis]|uniref:Acetyl esterase/lipase n=1 Tax=Alteribacillus iranensis TaxID=930128 RepID=A0A1I2E9Z9_9BACI|nr:alpha/beta hydrolase [Alteribacillus iranensis]SFE89834.1 Acetyl esterase/lipase [Alteribacillus iranensis]